MVSSTFYDLKQLRQNLHEFIENALGWRALLSEHRSFPISPDADTIENCRRRVQQDADILILIVGARYGYVDSASQKSITNLEYLAARSKGIPVYAFVSKGIIPLIPIWEKNPSADFSGSVDNPALFEFVRQVRSVHKTWTHEFEYAEEIVSTLRHQFAYLVADWMQVAEKIRSAKLDDYAGLSPEAVRIALEEPDGWEYLLFFTALKDQVALRRDLRRQYELGIALGPGPFVEDAAVTEWIQAQMSDISRISSAWEQLLNNEVAEGLGPPGVPGNKRQIVFAAKNLGAVYQRALEWTQHLRSTHVSDRFVPVLKELGRFSESIVTSIEALAERYLEQVTAALGGRTGDPQLISIDLSLKLPNLAEFERALKRAQR
jgi:hypothetical protein